MRSYNVLLLITLVTISFSNAFEFTNLNEVKQLRSSSYGNSLIETISLTLESGNIDEVTKLLADLLFKLNEDQAASTRQWEKVEKEHNEQIDTLNGVITALETSILNDKAEKLTTEGLRDQSEANLVQYRAQVAANVQALADNEDNRNKDQKEFEDSARDHNDVINAIEAVITELNNLQGSVSGVAKPVHVDELGQETRDREFAALKGSFVQLTKSEVEAQLFVQMATSADQESLANLIKLLRNLIDSTKNSLNKDVAHNEASIDTHAELKDFLTVDNERLAELIEEQKLNLDSYNANIERLSLKITAEEALLTSKRNELVLVIASLNSLRAKYLADKAERDQERGVIVKLQGIVAERLANMSKFLRGSTSN